MAFAGLQHLQSAVLWDRGLAVLELNGASIVGRGVLA
ncbi:unnamed protein product [Tetraodon nigroviridis]|uniref:Chromosome 15 SCAF14667, whole genome shotgun sequence n=1 Tax=Tetraodon nigroviridis TaxID=99883 RepID=Q4SBM0_TETNG|nr:unnamed protein product [Tetraodon nigroviridis]